MALGSLECSSPSAWPSSCTATRKRSFPVEGEMGRCPGHPLRCQSVHPLLQQTPSISFVPGPVPDTGTYTPLPSRTLHIVVDRDRETK